MADHAAIHPSLALDLTNSGSTADSPSSSVGAARTKSRQLPISRNTAAGTYERPERARTSHACEPCRERKTKCDGERPACRRCLHTNTQCHYGYGKGWKKRKTVEDLNVTSWKLAKYEQLLDDIMPMVAPEVRIMIEDVRSQDYAQAHPESMQELGMSLGMQMEGEYTGASPNMNRMPMQLPNTAQQGQMYSHARSIPASPTAQSGSQHTSGRSPTDDVVGSPVVRLPSITRQGHILDGGIPIAPGLQQMTEADLERHQSQEASDQNTYHGNSHG